nr:hypothetical protein [Tanacetum cinerariifolium]
MKDLKELLHLIRSFFTELLIIKSRRIWNVRLRLSLRNNGFRNRSGNNRGWIVKPSGAIWLLARFGGDT